MDEIIDKWVDALSYAETWDEKNLIQEFLEDLKWLTKKKG